MHCAKAIGDDIYWVGGNDRRISLFENRFPVPQGMSYNAYVLMDEKTVLLDTVDHAVSGVFFENLEQVLGGRPLDYVVVDHMEPDHSTTLGQLCARYPGVRIVTSAKAAKMMSQFFPEGLCGDIQLVAEGDTLETGKHTLAFYMAPMVHWPEVMVTYDRLSGTLFSADAFGTFGALNGQLAADQVDFEKNRLADARRYYANIVGKYGPQVQALLKKASSLDIRRLCPLHGPIWQNDIEWYVNKYQLWSQYLPEEKGVVIVYGSIYGHTEAAAELLAAKLAERGIENIALQDASTTHSSVLVAEAFRASHLALCAATYNAGLFTPMEQFISELKAHGLKGRAVSLMENGSWAPMAGKLMREALEGMKDMRVLEKSCTILSALKPGQDKEIDAMAEEIAGDMAAMV